MNNIIVKTTGKRVLYFYAENGICLRNLILSSTNPKMIFEYARGDFDVIEAENGEVGIICQDNEGCIVFLRESGNEYLKSTLLVNKNKKAYDKHFSLHKHGKRISAMYVIDYDGKKILSHQIIDNENATPCAVDEIYGASYFSFTDKDNNIIAVYNKVNEAGYRIFRWETREWGGYRRLCAGRIIAAADDTFGNLYMLCENEKAQFYLKAEKGFLEFSDIKTEESPERCTNAVMFFEDDFLWVLKEDKDKLFGTKLTKSFETVSRPMLFGNDVYKKIYSVKTREKKYRISRCFGYETNNIPKLIVYKNLYNTAVLSEEENTAPPTAVSSEPECVSVRKETREEAELNRLKLKIIDLQKRLSRIENTVNNK